MTEQKYTMLVVDDNKINRTMLNRIFRDKYNILMAENGVEAMATLGSKKVDVMILDILMPEMDGYQVIAAVRNDERLKEIPIVITTAEREQSERRALELGADDFIIKPYDSVVVEKRVENITQRYILEREKMEIMMREHEIRTRALVRQAEEDALTGINNRMGFRRHVQEMLDEKPSNFALLLIDVDFFKIVNDKYGHPIGDELLIKLARDFKENTLAGDVVGRIGGDEFAVYLNSVESRENAVKKANTFVEQALKTRKDMGLVENHSVSVGIVFAESCECRLEDLYKTADKALYLAKENGKGCAFFIDQHEVDEANPSGVCPALTNKSESAPDKESAEELNAVLLTESASYPEMVKTLKSGEFVPYIQPICMMSGGRIVGGEALMRRVSNRYGLVLPELFIREFEKNGFIGEIDRYMLECICRCIEKRHKDGLLTVPISINLSQADIFSAKLLEYIENTTRSFGVFPSEIITEITEKVFVSDDILLSGFIKKLRNKKFSVGIDNFGKDYAALNTLEEADTVKLDAQLVHAAVNDKNALEIARAIINAANSMGIKTIAVGVETEQQAELMLSLGAKYAQGYYFYKPMPVSNFERLLVNQ